MAKSAGENYAPKAYRVCFLTLKLLSRLLGPTKNLTLQVLLGQGGVIGDRSGDRIPPRVARILPSIQSLRIRKVNYHASSK
jgi:hypothetical protein